MNHPPVDRCKASPICELEHDHAWDSVSATGHPTRVHVRKFGRVDVIQDETITDTGVTLPPPYVFVGEVENELSADAAAGLAADLLAAAGLVREHAAQVHWSG